MTKLLPLLLLSLFFVTSSSLFGQNAQEEDAKNPTVFQVEHIALLNSSKEFGQRAGSAQIVADYIKAIESKLKPLVEKEFSKSTVPRNGLVAVAIRPGGSSKIWVDVGGSLHEEMTGQLESELADVGAPQVVGGPVAFTINFKIWGGVAKPKPLKVNGIASPALPASWEAALKGRKRKIRVPDELLPLVWPENSDDAKRKQGEVLVPDGFVLQSLDPLGGSILRPKAWHYSQGRANQSVVWTISKEPVSEYVTGVRVQLIAGIKKSTGETPEAFMKKFIETKKQQVKTLSEREPMEQGGFTRIGLETEEAQPNKKDAPPFRILYSCFWNNKSDMAAIVISGTTTDLWEEHQKTFNIMAGLTLVDLKKVKATAANSKSSD